MMVAVLTLVASTTHQDLWNGFPLPSGIEVVEDKRDADGNRVVLSLVAAPEKLDHIHDFYQSYVGKPWERCPSSNSGWVPQEDSDLLERCSAWVNRSSKCSFQVITEREMDGAETQELDDGNMRLVYHNGAAPVMFDLILRTRCGPRNSDLFSVWWAMPEWRLYCSQAGDRIRFDAHEWRSTADEKRRGLMILDLMCGSFLLGLGRDDVLKLLGPPDYRDNTVFGYRLYRPDFFDGMYAPPSLEASDCDDDWGVLEFDFDGFSRGESKLPFWLYNPCLQFGV
jgi:hypothetical protein